MKRKNEEMQGELSNLRQLYDFLRLKPEQEALEILRRIRAIDPGTTPSQHIQELTASVRHGDILAQPSNPPLAEHQPASVTLPPIRMALDTLYQDPRSMSSANSLPFPTGILAGSSHGPINQKRRNTSKTAVSAR
jgi:hypothetical protein